MTSTEATPRYRNFSNNMPASINPIPAAPTSLITVEKEPEPDPEAECFMCRQAHVYVKPIGMQQERRVARRLPPPLTRAEIDELSRKKSLTKKEARQLLQCYFPEIKHVKYFQLHKYHSCCYDPKHLNLCKNHITALQHERDQHPNHYHHNDDGHDESRYTDYSKEGEPHNRVSFVRIKIEPTKGIPTRFLGPAALPESLADMLIKQVNRLENKKTPASFNSNHTTRPYNFRRVEIPQGLGDEDDDEDESDDDDDNHAAGVKGKIMAASGVNYENSRQEKEKLQKNTTNGDLVVEDLDQLNRLYIDGESSDDFSDNPETLSKPWQTKRRKKVKTKKNPHDNSKTRLKHWEILALEQAKKETCNCRHHVMRLEADHIVYDWCRCKDHKHKELMQRYKSDPPAPAPPPPAASEVAAKTVTPVPPKPRPKPRKIPKKSVAVDATEPTSAELALAYDPSTVDYDMIQEAIYYRTSSGRLIKPEVTNAFSYDSLPPSMNINHRQPNPHKAEVLYMTPNGQLQPFETAGQHRGKKSIVLTKPGTLYNGQALIDPQYSPSTNDASGTMSVVKLPPSIKSSRRSSSNKDNQHQPAEFTLANFSSNRSSKKPTYSNQDPTPNYGRQSSIVANRRWFDQPLGDENLRPVHEGHYGLVAGTSGGAVSHPRYLPENDNTKLDEPKSGSNCTIS